jgi:uncharacterized RDD family membrane protein YckC
MTDEPMRSDLLSVETPESVAFAYRLAGLGSRGFALILDTLMVGLIGIGEGLVAGGVYLALNAAAPRLAATAVPWIVGAFGVVVFLTAWGYFIVGEVFGNGRTWGKRWMGLRVVRDDGSRVRAGDSIIRNLLRIADALPGNYTVGMFAILFTRQHKRLGDMAAGTVVIRDETTELRLDDGGEDARVLLAREFLDRRAGLATAAARWQVGVAVLGTFGEQPAATWDEATLAGRIADLCGWRELHGLAAAPSPVEPAAAPTDSRTLHEEHDAGPAGDRDGGA